MDHHIDQPSSHVPTHLDELQLAVLTQQNRRLTREILPFEVRHYQHQDELNILEHTTKQLKYHYSAVEQQPHLSLPEKASQFSRTAFLSYLFEIYGTQLTKGSVLFICDPLTNSYISLIYDTLFHLLSNTLFEFLNGIWSEIKPSDKEGLCRKSSFEFLKRLAPAPNTNTLPFRKESVHKIARQEIEGFAQLLKIYISSVTDADLNDEEIFDSLTLLSWYLHRFLKSLVRHIFPATKLKAEIYPRIITKIPETPHYIYDPNWFPQNFVNITEIPSEAIQKLSINHQNIEIKNYNAEIQPFTSTNIIENANTSLEVSPIENMETLIHSQQLESRINETTETDFNSTLLDDGTLFSSHTVNTLIEL